MRRSELDRARDFLIALPFILGCVGAAFAFAPSGGFSSAPSISQAAGDYGVAANQKLCLDASCTRYLKYDSAANRIYLVGTASEYFNFNEPTEFNSTLFAYSTINMSAGRASSFISAQSPATDVFISHSGGVCIGNGSGTECDGQQAHGFDVTTVQTLTVANNAVGSSAATATLTPTSSYVDCVCNDPDGCTITMGETGMTDGLRVTIVTSTSNACNFADTSGVSETTGAIALGQWDSLTLLYKSDRWVELATSNN